MLTCAAASPHTSSMDTLRIEYNRKLTRLLFGQEVPVLPDAGGRSAMRVEMTSVVLSINNDLEQVCAGLGSKKMSGSIIILILLKWAASIATLSRCAELGLIKNEWEKNNINTAEIGCINSDLEQVCGAGPMCRYPLPPASFPPPLAIRSRDRTSGASEIKKKS